MSILNVFKNSSETKTNMESEIYEQPNVIDYLVKNYISEDGSIKFDLPKFSKVVLVASGSSYHSAAIAANFLRSKANCPAEAYYSSEFSFFENHQVDNSTLYVFISQSGETTDTTAALNMVKDKTEKTLVITNTENSTMYNNSTYKMFIHAGVENSIASTKALAAQIFCLYLVGLKYMSDNNMAINSFVEELKNVPNAIAKVFNMRDLIKNFAKKLVKYPNAVVISSGMFFPLAMEGSLKIKETSYISTSAYPTGEFLHGHIATLNNKCATIAIACNSHLDFTTKIIERIRTEFSNDCFVISQGDINLSKKDDVALLNTNSDFEFLFASLVILQLLAFETATGLGRNIDSPDGLSKVVK